MRSTRADRIATVAKRLRPEQPNKQLERSLIARRAIPNKMYCEACDSYAMDRERHQLVADLPPPGYIWVRCRWCQSRRLVELAEWEAEQTRPPHNSRRKAGWKRKSRAKGVR